MARISDTGGYARPKPVTVSKPARRERDNPRSVTKKGNLLNPVGAYTQPTVKKQPSVASLTGANNAVGVNQANYINTSTQADGVLGGQFGGNPAKPAGVGGKRPSLGQQQIQNIKQPFSTPYPTPRFDTETPVLPYTAPVVNLTGANNAVGVNQYNYLTPQQKLAWDERKRNEQITALTAPYTGSVAALTGANMVEPSNTGFPGTDPRQPYLAPNQYFYTPPQDAPPKYQYHGGGGGGGYNYTPNNTTGGYGYGSAARTRDILNWRIATG